VTGALYHAPSSTPPRASVATGAATTWTIVYHGAEVLPAASLTVSFTWKSAVWS